MWLVRLFLIHFLRKLVTTYQNIRRQNPEAHSPLGIRANASEYYTQDTLQDWSDDCCSFLPQHYIILHINSECMNILVLTAHNWHRVIPIICYGHADTPILTVTFLVLLCNYHTPRWTLLILRKLAFSQQLSIWIKVC